MRARATPGPLAVDLDCESEKALTLMGQIVAEQGRFLAFEALARAMASLETRVF